MKYFFWICLTLYTVTGLAQPIDTVRMIEPGREISFGNYDLLVIAIVGLLVLMGLRFWFKRTRKH